MKHFVIIKNLSIMLAVPLIPRAHTIENVEINKLFELNCLIFSDKI